MLLKIKPVVSNLTKKQRLVGVRGHVSGVYEFAVPPKNNFHSKLIRWFHSNNTLRLKNVKLLKCPKHKYKIMQQNFVFSSFLPSLIPHDPSDLSEAPLKGSKPSVGNRWTKLPTVTVYKVVKTSFTLAKCKS